MRDVYEALRATRHVAYTTVMTMMNILAGYLKNDKDRAFQYRPARAERTVIASMVREFVNRVFDGAPRPLLQHLVKDAHLDDDERRELLRLINESRK